MKDKAELRRQIIKERDHTSEAWRYEHSAEICRRLFALDMVNKAEDILLYADFGSEVKTGAIFDKARRMRKRVFYPRVEGEELAFYRVDDLSELSSGYRGIREPFMQRGAGEFLYTAVAIVPGAVFSRDGYRIGYGKGFYDRFLARYPKVFKLGMGYDLQVVESIPVEAHDVRLDGLITEKESIFRR